MSHDQLFKLLLQSFFREFLELFVPEIYKALEPAKIQFLDKELIRARGVEGKTKLVDLVARVRLAGRAGFVLVHVEHQARRQREIGRRMFLYAAWLMQRYDLPVYPILLTSYTQPVKSEPNRYRMEVSGFRVLDFRFHVVQLNRLRWRDYVRLKNPAAAALMARMRIAPKDRVKVKLQILRLIATLRLEPAKMDLIASFMENYLKLSAKEELAFSASLDKIESSREKRMVMELMTSWERKGRQEGRQEGREEGRQEGRMATVKGQLRVLLGKLTLAQETRLDALKEAQLAALAKALLDFSTVQDLERWLARHGC